MVAFRFDHASHAPLREGQWGGDSVRLEQSFVSRLGVFFGYFVVHRIRMHGHLHQSRNITKKTRFGDNQTCRGQDMLDEDLMSISTRERVSSSRNLRIRFETLFLKTSRFVVTRASTLR